MTFISTWHKDSTKNGIGNMRIAHSQQKGMSLIEVMIALAIFGIFITSYMSGQGSNLRDSQNMRSEIELRSVAEAIINEIIIDPPELRESLTLSPSSQNYEENDNFSYLVEWRKFEIQEILNALTQTDSDNYNPEAVERAQMRERINQQIAKNMEQLIWQLMVTVEDRTTGERFSLSTFIYNDKGQVEFGNF